MAHSVNMQQHMKQASTHAFSPCSTSGALKHIRSDLQAVSIHLNGSGCTCKTCRVVVAFGVQFFFLGNANPLEVTLHNASDVRCTLVSLAASKA